MTGNHPELDRYVDATLEQGCAHIRQYIAGRSGREPTLEGGVNFSAGTAAGTIFSPIVSNGRFIVSYPTMYVEDDPGTSTHVAWWVLTRGRRLTCCAQRALAPAS